MDKLGVLDDNFVFTHRILVNDDDIEILRSKNFKVSHNIGANAKGAKGVVPIIKMQNERTRNKYWTWN